jgi:ribonuclease HII
MAYPNLKEEKKLWKKGYKYVCGIDEAGRGPLAGPVVAATVSFLDYKKLGNKKEINDSKKIPENQREKIYKTLTTDKNIMWGIGIVSEKIIDKINILEATKLAMEKSVINLQKKLKIGAEFLILDGNFKINMNIPHKSIIKGDQKSLSVASASIIAKVTRDRIMKKYHKKYPEYGFDRHKGYGTVLHVENLKKNGLCKIHRKTFYPVKCAKYL